MPKRPSDGEASGGASSTSSSPYIAGSGPGFDPNRPPENAQQPAGDAGELGDIALEQWEEEQIREWLRAAGELAHGAFGVGAHDWSMTKRDLERISPPLTRILNRYEPSRAVAAFSDPAAAAYGFGMYGWRSTVERMAILREAREAEAHGGAGVAPGPQPPPPEPVVDIVSDGPTFAERLAATRQPQEDSQ